MYGPFTMLYVLCCILFNAYHNPLGKGVLIFPIHRLESQTQQSLGLFPSRNVQVRFSPKILILEPANPTTHLCNTPFLVDEVDLRVRT